jgi:hypothetical protein
MDLLCLMFESEERGVLSSSQRAWSDEEITLAVGGDYAVVLACVQELTLKGVANRQSNGALYSKRLVRDEHKRKLCIEAGKRGGNPIFKKPLKGHPKGYSKGDPKRNPTPSSSSSSSDKGIASSEKEVVDFVISLGFPSSDGSYLWHSWEASGWTRNGQKIKNWQSCVRAWIAGGFMNSQKPGGVNFVKPETKMKL